jgi:hypothetical protein
MESTVENVVAWFGNVFVSVEFKTTQSRQASHPEVRNLLLLAGLIPVKQVRACCCPRVGWVASRTADT